MYDRSLYDDGEYERLYEDDYEMHFANPGSALRAATPSNPRNLPCPTCLWPNRLTPADEAKGYHCDSCADALEQGRDIHYFEPEQEDA